MRRSPASSPYFECTGCHQQGHTGSKTLYQQNQSLTGSAANAGCYCLMHLLKCVVSFGEVVINVSLLSPVHSMVTWCLCLVVGTHTDPVINGRLFGTTWVSRYQKYKTNLDFTEARVSEWKWHQLDHMQVFTSLQTDNHANTPPLSFLQAGCSSCCPTNSVKALKAVLL